MKQWENIKTIREIAADLRKNLGQRSDRPKINISSMPLLNSKIWGLKERELTIVGARTSQGKSSLTAQISMDAADEGHKVWFLSLEMAKEDIFERLFCNMMKVDNMDLLKGQFKKRKDIQIKYDKFCNVASNWDMIITEGIGYSFSEILKTYEQFTKKPKVIMLDYLQAIKTKSGYTTDELSTYVQQFQEFAIKENIAVIIVSQINRTAGNGAPENFQLKGSGKIEEAADKCILLQWPWHSDNDEDFNKYIIRITKNRNGKTGKYECLYYPQFYKMTDCERNQKQVQAETPRYN